MGSLPCYEHLHDASPSISDRDSDEDGEDAELRSDQSHEILRATADFALIESTLDTTDPTLENMAAKNERLALENAQLRFLCENERLAAENAMLREQVAHMLNSPYPQHNPGESNHKNQCKPNQSVAALPPVLPSDFSFVWPTASEATVTTAATPLPQQKVRGTAETTRQVPMPHALEIDCSAPATQTAGTAQEHYTTVMLKNLPNNYTRAMLLALIDEQGFAGHYDFFYVLIDFKHGANRGCAFLSLTSHDTALRFWRTFDGWSKWVFPTRKHCIVAWGGPDQGLHCHVERFKNNNIMSPAVLDEFKPVIFCGGVRVPLPAPTRKLRAPRLRR
jgi:hypothetical protein